MASRCIEVHMAPNHSAQPSARARSDGAKRKALEQQTGVRPSLKHASSSNVHLAVRASVNEVSSNVHINSH